MSFNRLLFSVFLGLLMALGPARAQISVPSTPHGLQKTGSQRTGPLPTVRVDAPAPPEAGRTAPRPARAGRLQLLPQTYGARTPVAIDIKDAGARRPLADGGTLWRVQIEAPGARKMRLVYDTYRVPPGARFFVYDPEGTVRHGAFTERNNAQHGGFTTGFTPGPRTVLEYYEPPDPAFGGHVEIGAVVYATGSPSSTAKTALLDTPYEPAALECSINAACPEGDPWAKEARATVLIDRGGSTCSGVLVNNTAEDFSPYILTAHHCGEPAVGDTLDWLVTFNYASPTCANPSEQPPKRSMSGVVVRAAQSGWQEDYALLELLNPIPADYRAYYAGWSRNTTPPDRGITLGHPRGDLRKIALDDHPLTDLGARWLATFDHGTIEGGSSGAPLFDDHHRVVGHVRGAWTVDLERCSGPGGDDNAPTIVFPKLAHIWNAGPPGARVSDFLDPAGLSPSHLDGLDGAPASVSRERPWINEIDTRTASTTANDKSEFIEIAGPAGQSLAGYQLDVYSCTAGAAERQFSEVFSSQAVLRSDDDPLGFFVLGGEGMSADRADQYFSAPAPDQLPDGYGLLVLRDPTGRELFDYQYDSGSDASSRACPRSRTIRSQADDFDYPPASSPVTASDAKVALGSTAIGFQRSFTPVADDRGTEGIIPSPGRPNRSAMPVELTSFRAVVDEATVRLLWTTASETANAGFDVQHAMGDDFVSRGFVDGHGTTRRAQSYTFTMNDLVAGTHRFRLRQVDTDGSASLSPVVEIDVASPTAFQLTQPYPNPFRQDASLTLTVAEPQRVKAVLYDVLGRRVAVLHRGMTPARQPISLQVNAYSLTSGLYIMRVTGERFTASRKMTLLR